MMGVVIVVIFIEIMLLIGFILFVCKGFLLLFKGIIFNILVFIISYILYCIILIILFLLVVLIIIGILYGIIGFVIDL